MPPEAPGCLPWLLGLCGASSASSTRSVPRARAQTLPTGGGSEKWSRPLSPNWSNGHPRSGSFEQQLRGLCGSELQVVAEAASILAKAGFAHVEDLPDLHRQVLRAQYLEAGAVPSPLAHKPPPGLWAAEILPDLVQVHNTIIRIADSSQDSVRPLMEAAHHAASLSHRKWMFYLMPIWNDRQHPPFAREFWHAAHAVARDHSGDDWIAPHVTLHSRSPSSADLAEALSSLLRDLSPGCWKELLETLTTPENWILDADESPAAHVTRPSNQDHYVLHKAKVHFPEAVRHWLTQNYHPVRFPARKQDVAHWRKPSVSAAGDFVDKVPVTQPFHISLYSFRASRDSSPGVLPQGRTGRMDSDDSIDLPRKRKSSSYKLVVPKECSLRQDLAEAKWMFVFCAPGRTGQHAVAPLVLGAVPLESLAAGRFDCGVRGGSRLLGRSKTVSMAGF